MDSHTIVPHSNTANRPFEAHVVIIGGMDVVVDEAEQRIWSSRSVGCDKITGTYLKLT
jgi:hydroxyethylthiazole kinase-like sugar kinase family protein